MTATPELHLDGPALIFGGPYSNLQATAAVLDQAARLGIPPSRVICTGDLVAYWGDPAATIALVRRAGIHVVMGNCDEQLAQDGADCGCGFPAGSTCERLSAAWFAHGDAAGGRDAPPAPPHRSGHRRPPARRDPRQPQPHQPIRVRLDRRRDQAGRARPRP